MRTHMHREISAVKKRIITLGASVEKSVEFSFQALKNMDSKMADIVINQDENINQEEVLIEEECLKILALYQPVATDLRTLVAILKINNDLERMGDLACNVAVNCKKIALMASIKIPTEFEEMYKAVLEMTRDCIDCFLDQDIDKAIAVCKADEKVDEFHRQIIADVTDRLKSGEESIDALLYLISISRCVERIGDYATNIGEDVYYLITGEIIRHNDAIYQ